MGGGREGWVGGACRDGREGQVAGRDGWEGQVGMGGRGR